MINNTFFVTLGKCGRHHTLGCPRGKTVAAPDGAVRGGSLLTGFRPDNCAGPGRGSLRDGPQESCWANRRMRGSWTTKSTDWRAI